MNIRNIIYSIIFILLLFFFELSPSKKTALVKEDSGAIKLNIKKPSKPGTEKVEEKKTC